MPTVAELRGKLSIDTTGATASLRDFEMNLKGMFKRTGDLRAERALEGFSRALVSGDITGAIQSITSRITGFGIVVGAVFAVGVEAINKYIQALKETSQAQQQVFTRLAVPVKTVAALDTAGI